MGCRFFPAFRRCISRHLELENAKEQALGRHPCTGVMAHATDVGAQNCRPKTKLGMQIARERQMYSPRLLSAFLLTFTTVHGTAAFAYDPNDCLNDVAKVDPKINIGLATELCSGAWTPEPAKCYELISTTDEGIVRGIAVELCAGSVDSQKTVACYVKAGTERKLNRGLSTTLCSARKSKN